MPQGFLKKICLSLQSSWLQNIVLVIHWRWLQRQSTSFLTLQTNFESTCIPNIKCYTILETNLRWVKWILCWELETKHELFTGKHSPFCSFYMYFPPTAHIQCIHAEVNKEYEKDLLNTMAPLVMSLNQKLQSIATYTHLPCHPFTFSWIK